MIKGMDFSSLEETEKAGGRFYVDGKQTDLVRALADNGVNYARLRIWNDPYGKNGEPYMGGTCDINVAERLAKRARDAGMDILLDFHYSDFWCDPARQTIPKAWQGLGTNRMAEALGDFTAATLERLEKAGVRPKMVQVGNEITNGMLWPVAKLGDRPRNYEILAEFLKKGVAAVKNYSDAKTVFHLERSYDTPVWFDWFDGVFENGAKCDLIGASYYPYWHGTIKQVEDNLNAVIERYGLPVFLAEVAYPFTNNRRNPGDIKPVVDDPTKLSNGEPAEYEISAEGQRRFIKAAGEMIKRLKDGKGLGFFWWEPGWLGEDGTSWASKASLAYCGEEGKALGNEWCNQCLFDYDGNMLPALDEIKKLQDSP